MGYSMSEDDRDEYRAEALREGAERRSPAIDRTCGECGHESLVVTRSVPASLYGPSPEPAELDVRCTCPDDRLEEGCCAECDGEDDTLDADGNIMGHDCPCHCGCRFES